MGIIPPLFSCVRLSHSNCPLVALPRQGRLKAVPPPAYQRDSILFSLVAAFRKYCPVCGIGRKEARGGRTCQGRRRRRPCIAIISPGLIDILCFLGAGLPPGRLFIKNFRTTKCFTSLLFTHSPLWREPA